MHETIITVTGNVVAEPEWRTTSKGDSFLTFRLACTERKRDRSGVWADGHTNYVRVTAFRALAQNCMATLTKGMRVIVQGRLRVADWESGERRGTSVEIDAHAVGPELTFAHAEVVRGVWSGLPDRMADPAVQQAREQQGPGGLPVSAGYGGVEGAGQAPAPDEEDADGLDADEEHARQGGQEVEGIGGDAGLGLVEGADAPGERVPALA